MWHAFEKHNGKVVFAKSMELKAKDISCSGWQVWKEDNDWVKKCMEYEVEGARPRGRPKKTWSQIVQKDCQAHKLNREDAINLNRRRKQIRDD